MNYSNELYHHGVLGMKWGRRKNVQKSTKSRPKMSKRRKAAIVAGTVAVSAGLVYLGHRSYKKIKTRNLNQAKRAAQQALSSIGRIQVKSSSATRVASSVSSVVKSTAPKGVSSSAVNAGKKVANNVMNSSAGYSWESSIKVGKDLLDSLLSSELYHHGIKGMKWGVRRTKDELRGDMGSMESRTNRRLKNGFKAKNGVRVSKISAHALEMSKLDSRPVSVEGIIDALKNPLNHDSIKTKIDDDGRPSQRFIGAQATVNVNPENGVITTVWKTGQRYIKKYSGKGTG